MSDFRTLIEECFQKRKLFEDSLFAPSEFTTGEALEKVQWKRPKEFCNDPQFVIEGTSRFDSEKGYLENCCFVTALAALAERQNLFDKVVPFEFDFTPANYAGIFCFR